MKHWQQQQSKRLSSHCHVCFFKIYAKTTSNPDIIFVTSSTSSASVKYFWICVKLYRINALTTLLEGKCVKIITQDVSNCKENYTRG